MFSVTCPYMSIHVHTCPILSHDIPWFIHIHSKDGEEAWCKKTTPCRAKIWHRCGSSSPCRRAVGFEIFAPRLESFVHLCSYVCFLLFICSDNLRYVRPFWNHICLSRYDQECSPNFSNVPPESPISHPSWYLMIFHDHRNVFTVRYCEETLCPPLEMKICTRHWSRSLPVPTFQRWCGSRTLWRLPTLLRPKKTLRSNYSPW